MNRLVIIAGGTGGHIFPGLAVAELAFQHGIEVHWIGSESGMERQMVPDKFDFHAVSAFQFRGKGIKSKLIFPFRLLRAVFQARRLLKRIKPDVVIAFGGFVSAPGGIAAKLCGIPLIIHDQNARAGMANRYLAKIASEVLEAFPNSFPKSIVAKTVGNPVRQSLLDIPPPAQRLAQRQGNLHVLVLGGSLGARDINQTVVDWLCHCDFRDRLDIKHQTGKSHFDEIEKQYQSLKINVECRPFIEDMVAALSWADVVVCRAGAMTVSELACVGVAAIFIPMPHAVDNHQYYNAAFLSDQEAAILLEQKNLSPQTLSDLVRSFLDVRERVVKMSECSRAHATRDATQSILLIASPYIKNNELYHNLV